MSVSRVPAGVPTGGQFATSARAESTLTLDPAAAQTLNVVTGTDLPRLAFCSATGYDPDRFEPVRNAGWVKPDGGLWLSAVRENGANDWTDFLRRSCYKTPSTNVIQDIAVAPHARVVKIDSREDFLRTRDAYRAPDDRPEPDGYIPNRGFDFERLAADYDALWVTQRGLNTNTSMKIRPRLYSWDLPSVVVLNRDVVRPCS